VGAIPRAKVRRQAARFLAAARDCRAAQQRVLRELLALNATSRFSRAHGLERVTSVEEFRRRIPVTDYEYYRDAIEQLKLGDHAALLGEKNRLLMFSLSSGTTSQSKYIPITRKFLSEYRRGWQIWGIRALDDHPQINRLKIVQLSSDHDRFRTPGGTPCGNISGLAATMQHPLVRTMYTVPAVVSKIQDPIAKQYTTLRLALADEHVGMVMTANPSTLIHLARFAEQAADELIRDIADGALSRVYEVSDDVREALRRRIRRRDPRRARRLARLLEATGCLQPRDYWPQLALVGVWTGGSVGAYLHTLKRYYGDVPVRDHGLSASEGRMTIPLYDGRSDGVLDVTTQFFEFVPEQEGVSEKSTVLQAHELEEGRNYFILLTTCSGFCRYNISDVVRCTGFVGTTPTLEFLHKGAHIANITGEKVAESQVVAAVRTCVERMHVHLRHFTISPAWGDPPGYLLIAEEDDVPSPAVGRGLAEKVDAELQVLNCEYREKRQTGRLAPLHWSPLPPGTWRRYTEHRQMGIGGSLEQYKHPCLVPDLEFRERLIADFAREAAPARSERTRPARTRIA
jgi:hypothetical protein